MTVFIRSFRNVGWHKFYLSMENSLCDDYITEKFFTILQEYNTVKSKCLRNCQQITDPTLMVLLVAWDLGEIMQCNFMRTALPPRRAKSGLPATHYASCENCAIHLHNNPSRSVYVFQN